MYTTFFSLSEQPFSNTPDPKFFLQTKTHEEALTSLLYGVTRKQGFMVLTGDVGTGKTTMCRALLSFLGDTIDTALILNPDLSEVEILQTINGDFGLPSESSSKFELMSSLYSHLVARACDGRNALIIIDDAQNLPPRSMEQVRMISNFETNTEKLVQILLVGQPELNDKLDSKEMRQIKQRISVRPNLTTLSKEETRKYIEHRLKLAGGKPEKITFTESAINKIHNETKGYPRWINTLCDQALVAASEEGIRVIDKNIIREKSKYLRLQPPLRNRISSGLNKIRWGAATPLAALLVAGIIFFGWKSAVLSGKTENSNQGVLIQNKLSNVEQSLVDLEKKISTLELDSQANPAVQVEKVELEEDLAAAKKEAEKLRLKLRSKEKELKALQQEISNVEKDKYEDGETQSVMQVLSSLQEQESALKAGMENLKNESLSKDEEINRMEQSLGNLQKKLIQAEQEKAQLVENLRTKERMLASLRSMNASDKSSAYVEKLQTENGHLKEQQRLMEDIARQTIKAQEDEIARLTKEKKALNSTIKQIVTKRETTANDKVSIVSSH